MKTCRKIKPGNRMCVHDWIDVNEAARYGGIGLKNGQHVRLLRLALFACLLIFFLGFQPIRTSAIREMEIPLKASRQVLILNSYYPGYIWTENLEDTLMRRLEARFPGIDIASEYLDWKRHPDMQALNALMPMMKMRYADMDLDLVITTDDAALQFALTHRLELFPGTPIVFCGVADENARLYLKGQRNVTGVTENFDMEATAQTILGLYPRLKNVYLIFENTETGIPAGKQAEQALRAMEPNLGIVHWNGLSAKQIKDGAAALTEGSAILYIAYNRDINGLMLPMDQYADLLFTNSGAPVFSVHDFVMGHHILGGNMTDAHLHADKTADRAIRALSGDPVDKMPILYDHSSSLEFDYNEMKRFGIQENDLPKDATILNRPFSFYRTYKSLVIMVSAIFLMLVLLIVTLLLNMRYRRRSERSLRESHEELMAANSQMAAMNAQLMETDNLLREQNQELASRTESLSLSEERYRLVSKATRDAIWDWDIGKNSRIVSDRIDQMIGMTHETVEGMQAWLERIHPDDRENTKKELAEYLAHRVPEYSSEYRVKTKDGSYRWILARGIAIFGEDDKPLRMVGTHTDIDEVKQQQETISRMAYYDFLTELPNRVLLRARAESAFSGAAARNHQAALLFTDLDNFKVINDTFGHPIGDELLTEVAQRFLNSVSVEYTVARLGGDEFIVLVPDLKDRQQAEDVAQWLVERFQTPLRTATMQFHMGLSVGIALFPQDGRSFDELMQSADTAMYAAKEAGRNQYRFFDGGMDTQIRDRFVLEEGLRTALERKELLLHFQPIHRVGDESLAGFEALVRWNSPVHGLVPPNRFIPIAEETGLILPIGEWVLREACLFLKRVGGGVFSNFHMAVNVSVLQLMQGNFGEIVQRVLFETGVQAENLVLEITESVLMESFAQHADTLRVLGEMGVRVALDDFGTGYSSLTYLRKLPIQILKIDKSFIDDIHSSEDLASHTGSIIALARQWGFQVVAEGVEQDYQLEYLKTHHCDMIQGYLKSRPLPEEEAGRYARKGRMAGVMQGKELE